MKEMDILGISLKNYSFKEEMKLTEQFMKNGAVNTVIYLSAKQLIHAAEDEKQKELLGTIDLLIPADVAFLEATGVDTGRGRMKEIENNDYLKEFLRKAARAKYSIFLLAYTKEQQQHLKAKLLERQSNLWIAGGGIISELEEAGTSHDNLINEINDIAPRIIISKMSFEQYLEFIQENRMKINTDIILGLPEKRILEEKTKGTVKLMKIFYNKMLKRRVIKYNQDKAD